MKTSHVFMLNIFAALGYALGLLLVPAFIMRLHGIAEDVSTLLMARYFGVALLGIGLVCVLALNTERSKARDAITLGFGLSYIAGFGLSLWSTLTGEMNALGWLPTAIYLLLVMGFSYTRLQE